jgi:hypothetical protein
MADDHFFYYLTDAGTQAIAWCPNDAKRDFTAGTEVEITILRKMVGNGYRGVRKALCAAATSGGSLRKNIGIGLRLLQIYFAYQTQQTTAKQVDPRQVI